MYISQISFHLDDQVQGVAVAGGAAAVADMGLGVSPPVVVVCNINGGEDVSSEVGGLVVLRVDMGLGVSPSGLAVEGCIGRHVVLL